LLFAFWQLIPDHFTYGAFLAEPLHTNRLIDETSPYLLQHAHNPVDWYPWGEEAFERARREDRPAFLSVGYSACHWCHVMEHESFENDAIAALMNELFVNVKVDREERPDVDEIYMNAVQMITGQGGWPMSVFLTPDGKPFYGGTYFPPDNRYGRPGFPDVLRTIAGHYNDKRDKVEEQVGRLMEGLERMGHLHSAEGDLSADILATAQQKIGRTYDPKDGGFGSEPKFPSTMSLSVLLRDAVRNGRDESLGMVTHTLEKMARGGIYDQLGGGFHRYSVDREWLVPHFEKMLYDNALLARLYVDAWQVTGNALFRRVAEETLAYVSREMTHPDGGFYSTQDADSEGEEGKFFVWTPETVEAHLSEEDTRLLCRYLDVRPEGNFEHGNSILNVPDDAVDVARALKVDVAHMMDSVEASRRTLFNARESRVHPGLDDKIQANWNGLMISAFATAAQAFDDPALLERATSAATFVTERMRSEDGGLLHTWKEGQARITAYQEDYACVINGLVDVYEASFDLRWLEHAVELADLMVEQFWDEEEGGFFFIGDRHEALIVRTKNPYDNATPSGNSIATTALLRLGQILERKDYVDRAQRTLHLFRTFMEEVPAGFGQMLVALDVFLHPPVEVVLVGDLESGAFKELERVARSRWIPNRVIVHRPADDGGMVEKMIPMLKDRPAKGDATAYVCREMTCSAPVTDGEELGRLLEESG